MITDVDIKQIIEKPDNQVVSSLMCDVIQIFIFDKTKEKIQIKHPIGDVVPNATFVAGQIINDINMMYIFYKVTKNHYIEQFKDKVND